MISGVQALLGLQCGRVSERRYMMKQSIHIMDRKGKGKKEEGLRSSCPLQGTHPKDLHHLPMVPQS